MVSQMASWGNSSRPHSRSAWHKHVLMRIPTKKSYARPSRGASTLYLSPIETTAMVPEKKSEMHRRNVWREAQLKIIAKSEIASTPWFYLVCDSFDLRIAPFLCTFCFTSYNTRALSILIIKWFFIATSIKRLVEFWQQRPNAITDIPKTHSLWVLWFDADFTVVFLPKQRPNLKTVDKCHRGDVFVSWTSHAQCR